MPARRFFALLCFCASLSVSTPAFAQIPGVTSPAAPAPQQPKTPSDPLGRENPWGCILGFITAAQEENYPLAIQYFQPLTGRPRPSAAEEGEVAAQLLTILNQKFTGALDFISRDPLGRLDDGLPPDEEKVGGVLGVSESFPVYLVRLEDKEGRKLWYISRKTLEQVPEMYETLQFPELEKKIPRTLVVHRFLAMPFWQWLAILLFVPIALFAGRILTRLFGLCVQLLRKSRGLPPLAPQQFLRFGPATLVLATLIHFWFVNFIGASLLYRLYYRRVLLVFLAASFYWVLTRITRALTARIGISLSSRGMYAERSIVSLIRRFVEVTIFIFVALLVLHGLGFDVSTALAGVGIGTLALGLGAQKTFENMFGGISIVFDKVIQVGDTCKINNQTGVVEDIGLRSTRLRTNERTLLLIPNGVMASVVVENLRFRDKFLCQQVIRLRYDLSPDHLRYVVGEIREILAQNPKVEDATARVSFLRFAEYALEIEIYCYILEREYNAYLAAQEGLFLEIMNTLEKTGAVIALPSQTTIVTQDSWLDPDKAKAIKTALDKAHEPGVSGTQVPSP